MVGNKIVSIDLGGTHLRIAVIVNNKILKYFKEKTPKKSEEIKKRIFELIGGVMTKDVKGISVSSPGPLKNGTIMNPPNLPLRNYNLKKELENKFKVPAVVKHDSDCVALAERKLGYKKENFILLTLGTGIGGGIIINGELYRGTGYAGELGHIILDNGEYFENLAASKRLKEVTQKIFGEPKQFTDLINMKNTKADKILLEFTEYYGQGIGSLINCFDPECVILAGGVSEAGEAFIKLIREQVVKYSTLPKKTPVLWTKLKHPGVLGASLYFA